MRCTYASYSDIGGRKNNEDSFAEVKSGRGYLFVVADGLGGHGKGELASGIAIKDLKRHFCSKKPFDLKEAIQEANRHILEEQNNIGIKMKTTISVVWIEKEKTHFAHVGDSRTYAFLEQGIVYQSVDHSVSQMAVAAGEITLSEIRNHEDRNRLTRALGVSEVLSIDMSELPNEQYDRLLLCSDGFWEYVLEEEMCKTRKHFQTPKAWLKRMRKILRKRIPEKNDNNTAIAVIKRGV